MSYNKTNWQTGDVITAEKLNHLEEGVEAVNPLIVNFTEDAQGQPIITLNKTWQEIHDALEDGVLVYANGMMYGQPTNMFIIAADINDNKYNVYVLTALYSGLLPFASDSSDGYPSLNYGG